MLSESNILRALLKYLWMSVDPSDNIKCYFKILPILKLFMLENAPKGVACQHFYNCKHTFPRIQWDPIFLTTFENLFYMLCMFFSLLWKYRDIVEIYYNTTANQTGEIYIHIPLESSSSVDESKGKFSVSKRSPFCSECSF